jgi:hypothetical protein
MAEKKSDQIDGKESDPDQRSFRNAVIAYAIIEALILIPIILYLIFK